VIKLTNEIISLKTKFNEDKDKIFDNEILLDEFIKKYNSTIDIITVEDKDVFKNSYINEKFKVIKIS